MKTITDLIQELEQIRYEHGDLPVLVDGYEINYDAACAPKVVETADHGADHKLDAWWAGRYIEDPDINDDYDRPRFKAVVVPR